jgi:hypothetical protein
VKSMPSLSDLVLHSPRSSTFSFICICTRHKRTVIAYTISRPKPDTEEHPTSNVVVDRLKKTQRFTITFYAECIHAFILLHSMVQNATLTHFFALMFPKVEQHAFQPFMHIHTSLSCKSNMTHDIVRTR